MPSTAIKRAISPNDTESQTKRQNTDQPLQRLEKLAVPGGHVSQEQSEILRAIEDLLTNEHLWDRWDTTLQSRAWSYLVVLESQCRMESWTDERTRGIASILDLLYDVLYKKRTDDAAKYMVLGYTTGFRRGMQVHPTHKTAFDRQDEDGNSTHFFYSLQKRMAALVDSGLGQLQDFARSQNTEEDLESAFPAKVLVPYETLTSLRAEVSSFQQELANLASRSARDLAEVRNAQHRRNEITKLRYINIVERQITALERKESAAKEKLEKDHARLTNEVDQATRTIAGKDNQIKQMKEIFEETKRSNASELSLIKQANEALKRKVGALRKVDALAHGLQEALAQARADTTAAKLEHQEAVDQARAAADATKLAHEKAMEELAEKAEEDREGFQPQLNYWQSHVTRLGLQVEQLTKERDKAVSYQAYQGHMEEAHYRMHNARSEKLDDRSKELDERERLIEQREQAVAERELVREHDISESGNTHEADVAVEDEVDLVENAICERPYES
ncbi:hypothetical protein K461DRAFT_317039 [Myriangium duriaei CBS 260.36]|uniref:Uncharacterized protein n=1 Tax=Myriangium duriaei CBS 260.36 TaxID=1168546 RepID=A0A9P4J8F9_9PEZI|nr:hypothetical protein K461DRAFT_317039 [Myriangium duriaei CBS 260.36]